jgi:hypothetical protein
MMSTNDAVGLTYDVTYRATAADGMEAVVRLKTSFEAATLTDAWGRLTALYDGVDPLSIEIELRESPRAPKIISATSG